ncbi:hypothetical protein [Kribbella sp. CA-293567]|uniref:hypothetical protein n=1 Tax=Kribbella sp. CA-293567 TaxID=3002436 RepID=UPI0022DDC54F|nr:hypothetical protein [Kribbella sp. CA-293567]WBQ04860.1 hypothetical protein OX958_33510 [Kribbella sp. CA-293567]
MRSGNGVLAAAMAAVAVVAVAGGGALAAGRKSVTSNSALVGPLAVGPTATPTPRPGTTSPTARATPSTVATTPPPATPPPPGTPTPTLPTVKVELARLPQGRAPQVVYLDGRVVKGGLGSDVPVPGRQQILRAARYDGDALVVLEVGLGGSELVRVDSHSGIEPERVADVASLVSNADEDTVAFGTARSNPDHTRRKGNVVHWRNNYEDRKLDRPGDWESKVLAVVGETVYFAALTDRDGPAATLNSWHTRSGKVEKLRSFKTPAGVDFQGANGVDELEGADQTFCSAIRELGSGKQLWRTCEHSLDGFTPDGRTVFATPDFHAGGSDPWTSAIDTATGTVRRQWTGVQFLSATAEDDNHLLMVVANGERTPGAIIRCSIDSGACELATKPARTAERDRLRLMGGWG